MQLPVPSRQSSGLSFFLFLLIGVLLAAGAGALFRYATGRLAFDASLVDPVLELGPKQGGTVASIETAPGHRVKQGQVLLRFDAGPGNASFAEEQARLEQLARLLPPDFLFLTAPDGKKESLSQRLERQRSDERAAELALQDAADLAAQASVLNSRAAILASQGKLAPARRAATEKNFKDAEKTRSEAKARFEQASLERSATDGEIRRLLAAQAAVGADRLPAHERIAAYEKQIASVERLAASKEAAVLTAPAAGTVVRVLTNTGERLAEGAPGIVLRPDNAPYMFAGLVSEADARKLAPGMRCVIRLSDAGQSEARGYVASIVPAASRQGSAQTEVQVAVMPHEALAQSEALAGHVQAGVTVLLREPPYSLEARQAARLSDERGEVAPDTDNQEAPEARAVPPASPLRVETPFGQAGGLPHSPSGSSPEQPPSAISGSPEDGGKAGSSAEDSAPSGEATLELPPMKAPYPLKGSSLPDPANNPSIVPFPTLEPVETRP